MAVPVCGLPTGTSMGGFSASVTYTQLCRCPAAQVAGSEARCLLSCPMESTHHGRTWARQGPTVQHASDENDDLFPKRRISLGIPASRTYGILTLPSYSRPPNAGAMPGGMLVLVALVLLSATTEGQLFDAEAPEPTFDRHLSRLLQSSTIVLPDPSPSPDAGTATCENTCNFRSVRAHLLHPRNSCAHTPGPPRARARGHLARLFDAPRSFWVVALGCGRIHFVMMEGQGRCTPTAPSGQTAQTVALATSTGHLRPVLRRLRPQCRQLLQAPSGYLQIVPSGTTL